MILLLVTLLWNPNTEADLSGYRVYWGTTSNYTNTVDVGNVTRFERDFPDGTYRFAVTAYDFSGNESGFSEEVVVTLGQQLPAPTGVRAVDDSGQILVTCDPVTADRYYFHAGREAGNYNQKLSRSDPAHRWSQTLYPPDQEWHFAVSYEKNGVESELSPDLHYVPAQGDQRIPSSPGFSFFGVLGDTLRLTEQDSSIKGTLVQVNRYADGSFMPEGSIERIQIETSLDGVSWNEQIANWQGTLPKITLTQGVWMIRFRTSSGAAFSEPSVAKFVNVDVETIFTWELEIPVR